LAPSSIEFWASLCGLLVGIRNNDLGIDPDALQPQDHRVIGLGADPLIDRHDVAP
jgi:hypothetical protein